MASKSGLTVEEIEALELNLGYRFESASKEDLIFAYNAMHGTIPKEAYVPLHKAAFENGDYEAIREAGPESAGTGFTLGSSTLATNEPVITMTFSRPDGLVARTRLEVADVDGFEEEVRSLIWITNRLRERR